jgi:predicted RecB family nuclease
MSIPLTEIKGIGASTARDLQSQGITSVEDMAAASIEQITAAKGFGGMRASQVKEAAMAILRERGQSSSSSARVDLPAKSPEPTPDAAEIPSEAQEKKKKDKPKKGKKEKKKKKGKKEKKAEKGKK